MKYAKVLGLLALSAAALLAFVGSASATTLTETTFSPHETHTLEVGDEIHAESVGATTLDGTINISCNNSTVRGKITNAGGKNGAGETEKVRGNVETLTFTNCGNHTVEVVQKGSLTIISNGDGTTGTVVSHGATVTVLTHSLFLGTRHCNYVTNETTIGTFTESTHTPTGGVKHDTATMHINSPAISQEFTDSLCGNDAKWTGTYVVLSPHHLTIH